MKADWFVALCVTVGLSAIVAAVALPHLRLAPVTSAAIIPESTITPTGPAKILFVGDTMLDRSVAVHMEEVGGEKLFAGVAELFAKPDLLVGNLEGTITTNNSIAQQDHTILHFTFATTAAELLARVGFNIVSLANNHSLDFGLDGYHQTIDFLHDAGIGFFGSPYNDLNIAVETTVQDKKFCFIGYHGLFDPDTKDIIVKIKEVRSQCDYIVVFSHWGVEYQHEPTTQQRQFAHDFIDAGADLIIGAHPHIVEPLEIYKNHAIFYSLGNFLFDQGFSAQVKRGLAVQVEFDAIKTRFTLTPVVTYKEVSVAATTTRAAVLDDVVTQDLAPDISKSIKDSGTFELQNIAQ